LKRERMGLGILVVVEVKKKIGDREKEGYFGDVKRFIKKRQKK
jgi:hypothetical protein